MQLSSFKKSLRNGSNPKKEIRSIRMERLYYLLKEKIINENETIPTNMLLARKTNVMRSTVSSVFELFPQLERVRGWKILKMPLVQFRKGLEIRHPWTKEYEWVEKRFAHEVVMAINKLKSVPSEVAISRQLGFAKRGIVMSFFNRISTRKDENYKKIKKAMIRRFDSLSHDELLKILSKITKPNPILAAVRDEFMRREVNRILMQSTIPLTLRQLSKEIRVTYDEFQGFVSRNSDIREIVRQKNASLLSDSILKGERPGMIARRFQIDLRQVLTALKGIKPSDVMIHVTRNVTKEEAISMAADIFSSFFQLSVPRRLWDPSNRGILEMARHKFDRTSKGGDIKIVGNAEVEKANFVIVIPPFFEEKTLIDAINLLDSGSLVIFAIPKKMEVNKDVLGALEERGFECKVREFRWFNGLESEIKKVVVMIKKSEDARLETLPLMFKKQMEVVEDSKEKMRIFLKRIRGEEAEFTHQAKYGLNSGPLPHLSEVHGKLQP